MVGLIEVVRVLVWVNEVDGVDVVDGVVRFQMSPAGEEGEGDKVKPDQRGW